MSSRNAELTNQADAPCPCGSGSRYAGCCQPLIEQQQPAKTAEALMRSRFTAHVRRDYAYLHRTDLSLARKPYVEINDGLDPAWTRLVIHTHEAGAKPDTAFVDFSAYFEERGVEHALHEKSEFQRVNGVWFYTRPVRTGPAPVKLDRPKTSRNEPCPCGSGKKFKHCCGR